MSREADNGDRDRKSSQGVDWSDPSIPAGDSPPHPTWPLVVSGVLWGGWVVFLAVVAVTN